METFDEGADALTAQESWQAIHTTMDEARSSLYVAGSAGIMLLWGVIVSVAYFSEYAISTLASDFAAQRPWYPGPLWGSLCMVGMVGSSIIGHRASERLAAGTAARRAGLRVFFYWITFTVGAWLILWAAGLLTGDDWEATVRAILGFAALAWILFGIMTRVVIALTGAGFAIAYFVPHYLLDDAALAMSGVLNLVTFGLAFAWIRKTGEW